MDVITASNEAYGIFNDKGSSKRIYDTPIKTSDQQESPIKDGKVEYGIFHHTEPSLKRIYDTPFKAEDQQEISAKAQHAKVYLETKLHVHHVSTPEFAESVSKHNEYGEHMNKSEADKDFQKQFKRRIKPKQNSKYQDCICDLFLICLTIISMMMSITVIVCVALLTTNDARLNNDSISGG